MRRDKYRDYVTGLEIMQSHDHRQLILKRELDLIQRSGAANVVNSRLIRQHSLDQDALMLGITFSSSAWTGR